MDPNTGPTYQIKERIATLESALNTALPGMPTLLREIHTKLREDTSLITTLSDEEVAVIVRGLKIQTATQLIAPAKKAAAKQSKPVDADEL